MCEFVSEFVWLLVLFFIQGARGAGGLPGLRGVKGDRVCTI